MKIKIYLIVMLIVFPGYIFGQYNTNSAESFNYLTESIKNDDVSMALKFRFAMNKSTVGQSYNWEKTTQELQGIDEIMLQGALEEIKDKSYVNSLVIIKNGLLVKEEYYNGGNKDILDLTFSVTKSIMSTLVGIAIDKGFIDSVDQAMMDFFPEYNTSKLDPRKNDITIKHLLMMQSGFDYETNIIDDMRAAPNMIQAIINTKLKFDPGTDYLYSTHGTHILSGIITKATNMSTKEFAEKYLFKPLGIKSMEWTTDQNGIYFGGAGIYLTPRDMARFGYLFLQNGVIDGRKIISSEWINIATCNHRSYKNDWREMNDLGYGFSWWTGEMHKHSLYFAAGYGGQWILLIPDLDIIIVTTMNDGTEGEDWHQMASFIPIICHNIMPIFDEEYKSNLNSSLNMIGVNKFIL